MSSPVSVNDRHLAHQDSSHSHMDPVKKENMCPIKSYAGFSLPGHGVDGVRKTNQDSLIMYCINLLHLLVTNCLMTEYILRLFRIEDTRTLALVFGCLDGHGTHGHLISQVTKTSNVFISPHLLTYLYCAYYSTSKRALRRI